MAHENTVSKKPIIPTRQYLDAADKNVAAVIVYMNDQKKYFYDEAFKKEVQPADMLHLFFNGVILSKEGTFYKAIACSAEGVIDFGL